MTNRKQRRAQLLETAVLMTPRRGFNQLTVATVAERAGVEVEDARTIFSSDAALQQAVIHEHFDLLLSDLDIADASRDPGERLVECLMQFLPDDDPGTAGVDSISTVDGLEFGAQTVETIAMDAMMARAHQRIENWLRILRNESVLRSDDTTKFATLLVALINGLILQMGNDPTTELGTDQRRVTTEEAVDILLTVVDGVVIKDDATANPRD